MIPVMQTIMHSGGQNGNCMQACVASLFELPLFTVPHFFEGDETPENDHGWVLYYSWFEKHGIRPNRVKLKDNGHGLSPAWDFFHLAEGTSKRGTRHCVIRKGFDIVHDPHPDDDDKLVVDIITEMLICDPTKYGEFMLRNM